MKEPNEIIRCLRLCRSGCEDCADDEGTRCSYYDYLLMSDGDHLLCMDHLVTDAAKVIHELMERIHAKQAEEVDEQ